MSEFLLNHNLIDEHTRGTTRTWMPIGRVAYGMRLDFYIAGIPGLKFRNEVTLLPTVLIDG